VEDQRPYFVSFHAQLNDDARGVLEAAGISLVGATGYAAIPRQGAELSEPDLHTAQVYASGEGEAAAKVADALNGGDIPFTPRGVNPG
jgi:hypothetical protein